ncbi:MAG: hypothetical protein QOJ65_1721, partial [Fimbriimonadaceae bacterium]|nr:hypothetical protein [Fimbriimonadaceae bacterium]
HIIGVTDSRDRRARLPGVALFASFLVPWLAADSPAPSTQLHGKKRGKAVGRPKIGMISFFASLLAAYAGASSSTTAQQPVMLAAAMIRHQEPTFKGGARATVAEIYPIAWCTGTEWLDASVDAGSQPNRQSSIREGDRFQIYRNGWQVGWFDVNRTAPKPYPGANLWVGLGGWSLPRKLYPYRLVKSRNVNYLANAIYTWGNSSYQNSIQPFLALNTDRQSLSSTQFSPGQMKRDVRPIVEKQMDRAVREMDPALTGKDLRLDSLRAYDLDNDRIPEVVAVFDLPTALGHPQRTLMLIGTVDGGRFIELYRAVNETIEWQPFDVLDVDGDGYKELVLAGRATGYFGFQVLQRARGGLKRVFQGASFGA